MIPGTHALGRLSDDQLDAHGANGQEILLEARRVLTFKPSLVLKNILNDEPVTEAQLRAESEE